MKFRVSNFNTSKVICKNLKGGENQPLPASPYWPKVEIPHDSTSRMEPTDKIWFWDTPIQNEHMTAWIISAWPFLVFSKVSFCFLRTVCLTVAF